MNAMKNKKILAYHDFGKRIFDLSLALPVFIITAPVMLLVYSIVYCKLGRPAFFKQMRPGLNGAPFIMYKFRTMTDERDSEGNLLHDYVRLTSLGKFLRKTSIDELPELLNVIRGDMSLVGPRPLLMEYLDRYTPEQARRHEARPGITGWAQVNGRNAIKFAERFKLDVWYVDNISFLLDIRIILMTVWKILAREGIDQPGEMEVFRGTKDV